MTIARVYLIPEWDWIHHLASFTAQTLGMFGIWKLVQWISARLDKFMPFENGPLTRIVFQQAFTLIILAPVVVVAYIFAKPNFPRYVTTQVLAIGTILFVVIIALFNFSFYASYFFKNWQHSVQDKADLEIQAARLEKEKFDLQYHQLRNQVNPHYLFNTLTSLDGLIHTNPELASEFVRHMAKVYRYVLQHKESEVVNLDEELEFIKHYISLQHIRYADGLRITSDVSASAKEGGIVMVTLQMLIDNAIKHNIVQPNEPLCIHITDADGYLIVHNNKQLRRQIETSNGTGILQLQQLYSFLTDKQVIIESTDTDYTIKIPLL
jgi:LytS/YehU family sensor histidine kinase